MPDNSLEAFGVRWNKKTAVFDPEDAHLDLAPYSTGLESLDTALGGGIPRGRTTMLYGEESAGKTLLAQLMMASVQAVGGKVLYIDAEHTYTPQWFTLTGVMCTKDKMLVVRPRTLEQGWDLICDAINTEAAQIVVVDSLPALVPGQIMDADLDEKDFIGLTARKNTMGVAKATQYNRTSSLVIVNQMRMNIGGGPRANPETYSGGRALRHHCSIVARVRRSGWLTEASEEEGKSTRKIGYMMRVRVEKNKVAPPWQETEAKVLFNGVLDDLSSIIGHLVYLGIIKGVRGYYEVPGVEGKVHGWAALEELIRSDGALRARLLKAGRP